MVGITDTHAYCVRIAGATTWQSGYKKVSSTAGSPRHREDSLLSNIRRAKYLEFVVLPALPSKLRGKSPNLAAESAGCDRSNLPASPVSLLVKGRAKKRIG